MSKALESGKSLAELVLAKLPENLRDAARTALLAPEASDALTLLGDSALARSDYSRQMDQIRDKEATLREQEETLIADYNNLKVWHEEQKGRLAKVETLEQQLARLSGQPPPVTPPAAPASGLSREDLEKYLAERDQARDEGYANVLGLTTTLAAKHLRDFNEVLDMNELIAHSKKHRVALYDPRSDMDAYRAVHGEKLKTKASADEQARIDKIVQERLAEERKTHATQPYPLRSQEPSVLDVLRQPDFKSTDYGVDAAVAEYERLQNGAR